MLMVPEIRRVTILLDAIPPEQRREVFVASRQISSGYPEEARVTKFAGFDSARTTAIFEWPEDGGTVKLRIPLDAVRSVWMTDDDHWVVSLGGAITRSPKRYWYYQPM